MNTVLYLILAHFLADFPFQSRGLVEYKQKHFVGVILHSATHFVASAVLLLPFLHLPEVWIGIASIFITHNIIDQIKISVNRKGKMNQFMTYATDQIAHLITISIVSYVYLGELMPKISESGAKYYMDQSIPLYVLLLTLSTYFYDVTRWTYRNSKKSQPYKRDYGMITRNAIIVTTAFVIYWISR